MCQQHGLHLNDVHISGIQETRSSSSSADTTDRSRCCRPSSRSEPTDSTSLDTYARYASRCRAGVDDLRQALSKVRYERYRLVGYGAATKGMTLFNFARLTASDVSYIVDDAPLLQDKVEGAAHAPFEQVLVVHNQAEVMRGLHFAEHRKTVIVLEGSILDVVVHLRADSVTYGQWWSSARPTASPAPSPSSHALATATTAEGRAPLCTAHARHRRTQRRSASPLFDRNLAIDWPFPAEHSAQLRMNTADQTSPPLKQVEEQILAKQRPQVPTILIYGDKGLIGR